MSIAMLCKWLCTANNLVNANSIFCVVVVLLGHTETGLRFKVPTENCKKAVVEPKITGLQGE